MKETNAKLSSETPSPMIDEYTVFLENFQDQGEGEKPYVVFFNTS